MTVDFIPPPLVRDLVDRIERARAVATAPSPPTQDRLDEPGYWERLFETNAAAVLAVLRRVQLPSHYAVHYRFHGRAGGDLLVRPFVARHATDVSAIRHLIDWHPAPDSVAPARSGQPTQDVDLLYRHFTFERSIAGFFEYWLAMQEVWASARWVHSRVIADAEDFGQVTSGAEWQLEQSVERFEPAVISDREAGAQLAVLLYCPLGRAAVTWHRIEIGHDQSVRFAEAIPIARGPSGYVL